MPYASLTHITSDRELFANPSDLPLFVDVVNMGYLSETNRKLKYRQISFVQKNPFRLSSGFEIFHKVRHCHYRDLCKISKRFDNWENNLW